MWLLTLTNCDKQLHNANSTNNVNEISTDTVAGKADERKCTIIMWLPQCISE